MSWQKIGSVTQSVEFQQLVKRAQHNDALATALQAALPDWLTITDLDYRLKAPGVLEIKASAGAARQLNQILPMLRQSLKEYGVKKVVLHRV